MEISCIAIVTTCPWIILDEDPNACIPPLLPNCLLIALDAVIQSRPKIVTFRELKVSTRTTQLDKSSHQTLDLTTFSKPSFKCPKGIWKEVVGRDPVHPFILDRQRHGSTKTLYQPDDPRLDLNEMIVNQDEYLTQEELEEAKKFGQTQIIKVDKHGNVIDDHKYDSGENAVFWSFWNACQPPTPIPQEPHQPDVSDPIGHKYKSDEWKRDLDVGSECTIGPVEPCLFLRVPKMALT